MSIDGRSERGPDGNRPTVGRDPGTLKNAMIIISMSVCSFVMLVGVRTWRGMGIEAGILIIPKGSLGKGRKWDRKKPRGRISG